MARYSLFVQTNARPGTDDEFNEWYNEVHLAEVLKIPGFVSARRWAAHPERRSPDHPLPLYRYLAIYDIEGITPREAYNGLADARPTMRMTETMEQDRKSGIFVPLYARSAE